jgi:hypothetical protein
MKTCSMCKLDKPAGEFHRRSASPDGLQYACKPCMAERDRLRPRRWDDPARRDRYFRQTYGLSLSNIEAMKVRQGGVCAICGTDPDRWVIDHCHETGVVRGALCDTCNRSLGPLKDNVDVLMSAASYLLAHENLLEVS